MKERNVLFWSIISLSSWGALFVRIVLSMMLVVVMSMIWVGGFEMQGLDFGQQVVYKACMEFLHPSQLEISFCLFRHQLVIWYFEKLHTAMILHDHNLFKGCSYNVWCGIGSSLHYRFLEVWTSVVLFGFPWSMWPLWTTICLKNQ